MNKNVAFSHKEGIILLNLQFTNGLIALVTENLDHHCLLDMFFSASHIGYTDAVAIHSKQRVTFRYEDWRSAIVGLE